MERSARRDELLAIARRSRAKWVSEASEKHSDMIKPMMMSKPVSSAYIREKVPIIGSVQGVFDLLSNIIGDGEIVDVEAIAASTLTDSEIECVHSSSSITSLNQLADTSNPFSLFIEKLKHNSAIDIVKSMQQFVAKFEKSVRESQLCWNNGDDVDPADVIERTESIWKFLDYICEVMKENALWVEETPQQWENTVNCCEKFIFIKLHKTIFASDPNDQSQDARISQRIQSLAFLTPEHLDIKSLIGGHGDTILKAPSKILQELQAAHCPMDKLAVIKKCSLAIAQALKDARTDGSTPGADEFLPMMILVLKESNPPFLNSTIKYLQRFTRTSKLVSEAGYLLTHFVSTVHFLENVDANALTIAPEEFDRCMTQCTEASQKMLEEMKASQQKSARLAGLKSGRHFGTGKNSIRRGSGVLSGVSDFDFMFGSEKEKFRWKYYGETEESAVNSTSNSSSINQGTETSKSTSMVHSGVSVMAQGAQQTGEVNGMHQDLESDNSKRKILTADNQKYNHILTILSKLEKDSLGNKKFQGKPSKKSSKSISHRQQRTENSAELPLPNYINDQRYGRNGRNSNGSSGDGLLLNARQSKAIAAAAGRYQSHIFNSDGQSSYASNGNNGRVLLGAQFPREVGRLGQFHEVTPDLLTMSSVAQLLEEYKLLVEACAEFTKGS